MCCEKETCWAGIDRADALGPFCSVEDLTAVLDRYADVGNPDYAYFFGLCRGKISDLPPEGISREEHLAVLDFMAGCTEDPCLAAEAAGYRDGILITTGFFD